MIPIAIRLDRIGGRFVGGFLVLDADGIGTDEVLYCETPVRRTRSAAIADASQYLASLN